MYVEDLGRPGEDEIGELLDILVNIEELEFVRAYEENGFFRFVSLCWPTQICSTGGGPRPNLCFCVGFVSS